MAKKRQENPPVETLSPKPASKKQPVKKRAVGDLPWHPFWRWLVSLCVVLHLLAVFSAPWNLSIVDALPPGYLPPTDATGRPQLPPAESVVWQRPLVARWLHRTFFHDYLNLLYLNHGYEFFAPDPSGTHVIDFQVTQSDGTVVEGRLPSHEGQWPRLLYHRHMMLAEQTPMMGPQSGQHYADHLATLHGGHSRMQLKMHLLLSPYRIADEMPLDAPSTFQVVGTVEGRPRRNVETADGTAHGNASDGEAPPSIPGGR